LAEGREGVTNRPLVRQFPPFPRLLRSMARELTYVVACRGLARKLFPPALIKFAPIRRFALMPPFCLCRVHFIGRLVARISPAKARASGAYIRRELASIRRIRREVLVAVS